MTKAQFRDEQRPLLAVDTAVLIGAVGAVAFFPVPAVNALLMSQVALEVPDALHGRALSAATQLTTLLHPVGPLAAGLALEALGTDPTIAIAGALFAVLAAVASRRPSFGAAT